MSRTILYTSLLLLFSVSVWAEEPAGELQPIMPSSRQSLNDNEHYGRSDMTLAVSPDGTKLVSTMNNALTVHDLNKPRKPRNRFGQTQQGRTILLEDLNIYNSPLAFLPDGKTIILSSNNNEDPAIHFIDLIAGKEIRQLDNDQQFFTLACSPDGKLLALGGQQRLEIWDAATGNEVRVIQADAKDQNSMFRAVAFSPTSTMVAAAAQGNLIQLFEVATGKERQSFRLGIDSAEPDQPRHMRYYGRNEASITALAFSADGRLLAAAAIDNSIRVLNLLTNEEIPPLVGHAAPVAALRFTSDGKSLISVDGSATKMTWNAARMAAPVKVPSLTMAQRDELWNDLGEPDIFRGYRAVRYLSADPAETVPFLEKRLKPVPVGDAKRLAQIVQELSNPNAGVRRKAMAEIRNHGEAGLGALMQKGEERSEFQSSYIMIAKLGKMYATPERQRSIKAVRVLESIGTKEARALLDKLAKGAPGTKLTTEAKAALRGSVNRMNNPRSHAPETAEKLKRARSVSDRSQTNIADDLFIAIEKQGASVRVGKINALFTA